MANEPSRRALLAGFAGLTLAPLLSRPALALDVEEARALISSLVDDINAIISSGQSEEAMFTEFERLFVKYSDVAIIAQSTLGVAARSASPAQMKAFTVAFQRYISRKYGRRFREFIGGKIEVKDARKVKSFYEVISTAFLAGSPPFEVRWHVSDKSGRDLFFNIIIEGVNMVASERTEIGAMLDKAGGDVDALVAALKATG